MHPNLAFRGDDPALLASLVDEVGFGMVFAATPDGPRVAHTPLLRHGEGHLRFHLARGNALTKHLDGADALALVNGPDAYISPRWYVSADQVPTWNYVAVEMEGPVRRLDADELADMLAALSAREEARVAGNGAPWTMDKLSDATRRGLLAAIVGFELEVRAWRPTLKLSQNKAEADRAGVIAGLETGGAPAVAALIRGVVSGKA